MGRSQNTQLIQGAMVADDPENNPRRDNLTHKALPAAVSDRPNSDAPNTADHATTRMPIHPETPAKIRPHDEDHRKNGEPKGGGEQKENGKDDPKDAGAGGDGKKGDDPKGGDEKGEQKDDEQGEDGKKKEDPAKKKRKRIVALSVFGGILIVVAAAAFIYWLYARDYETTDDAYIDGHVIAISPQVAARVLEVRIDDNFVVKQGEVLVRLDPTDYKVALDQANGAKAAMDGKLVQAKSDVAVSRAARDAAAADVDVAQVDLTNALRDLHRYEIIDPRARSQQQYDNAIRAAKAAQAQVEQLQAKVAQAEAQITASQANVVAAQGDVDQAAANVEKAQVNLGYCTISAPEDGKITLKNVEPGMYVTAGQTFFDIVPDDIWVVANFKETQLTRMRPNQPVTVEVDAYPSHRFHGHVDSIQAGTGARFSVLPAENATGNFVKVVQRVPVKIVFDRDSEKKDRETFLSPGLSVEPKVRVAGGDDED